MNTILKKSLFVFLVPFIAIFILVHKNVDAARNEWLYDKEYSSWYYLKSDDKKAKSEWIYDKKYSSWYYLKIDGKMAKSEWIYDKKYSSWYYLKSDGKMAKSEWIYDKKYNSWYYLKSDGKMAKSEWIYDKKYSSWYYLKIDGKMAKSEWVDNYFVDKSGKWIRDKKLNVKDILNEEQLNKFKISDSIARYYYKNIPTDDYYVMDKNGNIESYSLNLINRNLSVFDKYLENKYIENIDKSILSVIESGESISDKYSYIIFNKSNNKPEFIRIYYISRKNSEGIEYIDRKITINTAIDKTID
ncbi:hypothetical protein [Helcococcus ovis]|uniref:hypothetical protein n=1 Tax=Helcococcus ovis TaxID=72026 RepID=UPI0038BBFB00